MYRGTYYLNPDYGHDSHDAHDVVVIVLDDLIYDIAPATLPSADLLSDMKKNHELKDQQFVTVGYGTLRDDKTGGPHFLGDSDTIVSLTVTGDAWCRATDVTYRLDTDSARSYLARFVTLP